MRELYAGLLAGLALCIGCSEVTDDRARSGQASWALVEDLRLDATAQNLSRVSRIYVGPQGEIVVPEPQDLRVRLYDSVGTLVTSVGRRGSGPGEFQHIGTNFWVADTLVVWDARLGRVTYLLADGTFIRSANVSFFGPGASTATRDSVFHVFNPNAQYDDGSMLGFAYVSVRADRIGVAPQRILLRVTRDGAPVIVAQPPQFDDQRWSVTVSGTTLPIPFALQPITEIAADGSRTLFAWADQSAPAGETYNLTMLAADGDTLFDRSYSYRTVRIPPAALDSAIDAMAPEPEFAGQFKSLASARAPSVYPPLSDVTLGLDGTVWVHLHNTGPETPVVVLNERGDSIGALTLSARSHIQQASRAYAWVTETDVLGLTSVVRYRVVLPN